MTRARRPWKVQAVVSPDEGMTGWRSIFWVTDGLGLTEVTRLIAPGGPRTGQAPGAAPGQVTGEKRGQQTPSGKGHSALPFGVNTATGITRAARLCAHKTWFARRPPAAGA